MKGGVILRIILKMGRLTPEQRVLVSRFRRQGIHINVIMKAFGISRTTVWYWSVQDLRTRFNIIRNAKGKITVEVEATILFMRQSFKWGTARIQNGLISLPKFQREEIEMTINYCVQHFTLSRQAINEVLIKHKLNGYRRGEKKSWKFFRAKYVNELWQLDLKEFMFEGEKYHLLVCIDDYSRFILKLHVFDHSPDIPEISEVIKPLIKKYHPENILTDNSPFKESWEKWCKEQGTKAVFAHPYYPQDKGKVERTIRNIAEEYVYLLSNFPKWFNEEDMKEWKRWFNEERYHRGVKDYPANLYKC